MACVERKLEFTYFDNGARKTLTDPANTVTSYTYDGVNRTATVTMVSGVTRYQYYPDSRLKSVTTPTNVLESHVYDKVGRQTSLTSKEGASVVSAYGYTYDANSNRLTQSEQLGSAAAEHTSFDYDLLNRLTFITYPADADFPAGRTVTYTYDNAGNRKDEVTKESGGTVLASKTGTFDNVNRLTQLTDNVTAANTATLTYDPNGNQRTKTVGGAVTEYRYELRDRMVEALQAGTVEGRYQYDGDGRRIERQGEGQTHQYVYDQTSLLLEYDGAGAPLAKYDYGADRLIDMTHALEGQRYYHFDGLETVTALTDANGTSVASYHLDAWGNYRFPAELDVSQNRFGFTSHEYDKETNLVFAKARFYDPTVGRFTSQDSYLGEINNPPSLHQYVYANENPTTYVDRTGHSATLVGTALGFAWGVGQAVGSFANDSFNHDLKDFGEYGGTIVQNTIGGAEIGASVDATVLTGGAGLLASGGLGFAGVGSFTFAGKGSSAKDFAVDQVLHGAEGAALGLASAAIGSGAAVAMRQFPEATALTKVALRNGTAFIANKVPAITKIVESATEAGSKMVASISEATKKGYLGEALNNADKTWTRNLFAPLARRQFLKDVEEHYGEFIQARTNSDRISKALTVARDKSVFYSGSQGLGRERAFQAARNEGKVPIANTPEGKRLNRILVGVEDSKAYEYWRKASRIYAENASGEVTAYALRASRHSIWSETELPTLLDNPNRTTIDIVDPYDPTHSKTIR